MSILESSIKMLRQLNMVLDQLDQNEYTQPVESLNGSTIGQHTRHTLEFFICLEAGYRSGRVNYDERSHDLHIQSSIPHAADIIRKLITWLHSNPADKPCQLSVAYDDHGHDIQIVKSSFVRELVYNIEHAVHHMALIKVGLKEVCPHISPERSLGVAISTLRYEDTQTEPSGQ